MEKIIKISLVASFCLTTLYAEESQENRNRLHSVKKAIASVHEVEKKELDDVDGFVHMFNDAKVTGQIRSLSSDIAYKSSDDVYATAFGGFLKYELAEYKGFSAGATFVVSQNVAALSGDGVSYNDELSSSDKSYTQMSESYLNYAYKGLNLRAGRQTIDTPLADSDDIRMVADSFEAYIATYKYENFTFMGGKLLSWQGYDAGLDTPWSKTGQDGTYLSGLSWSDDSIDANLWYYNINGEAGDTTANNSYYGDIVGHFHFSKELFFHIGGQYLKQTELDKSGVSSEIYGAMTEFVAYGLGVNIAYNRSIKQKNKQSFSGFGGGTLFTSMDNMIVDNIAVDRDVNAIVSGISYEYKDFNFLYAYGDFDGDANSLGQKEHIVEQNIGFAYEKEKTLSVGVIFTKQDDKKETGINGGDWTNLRVLVAYNF
jgi:hypothetical protein